ncbi:MAG: hypothetical protein Rhob2KO_36200 [Rhodopirellula baltica]
MHAHPPRTGPPSVARDEAPRPVVRITMSPRKGPLATNGIFAAGFARIQMRESVDLRILADPVTGFT